MSFNKRDFKHVLIFSLSLILLDGSAVLARKVGFKRPAILGLKKLPISYA